MENLKTGYPSKDQMWNQYYDEAFFNLLPLPAFDGGRILFMII